MSSSIQTQPINSTPVSNNVTAENTAKNASLNDPKKPNAGGGLKNANDEITPEQAQQEGLPEQKHAGAVGYGPDYANKNKPTMGEKITGIKETLVGKVTKNPELVQTGHDRKTGELKRREQAEKESDPFATEESKKTDSDKPAEAEPLGGGKSSEVDLAAGKSRLTEDPSHPAAQDEGVQRASAV